MAAPQGVVVTLAEFEAAVLVVLSPPPSTSDQTTFRAATAYIQHLAAQPDAYRLAMHLLQATSHAPARFFCLQALAQYVGGPAYAAPGGEGARAELRAALLGYARARATELAGEAPYVRAKLALCFALSIKRDYPEEWPGAFAELIALVQAMAGGGGGSDAGGLVGCDLFLRVLACVQEEVVDPRINRPRSELAHNMIVKDAMRTRSDCGAIANLWLAILSTHGDALLAAAAAASGSALRDPPLHHARCEVVRSCLALMAAYADWIDVSILAAPPFVARYAALLGAPAARCGVAAVVRALVDKGMSLASRIALIRGLGLINVAQSLTASVETALSVPGAAGDPAPYGDSGSEDDATFGEAVARLIYLLGHACMSAGEDGAFVMAALAADSGTGGGGASGASVQFDGTDGSGGAGTIVSVPAGTLTWVASALRDVLDCALRLLDRASIDASLGLTVLPLMNELVACLHREAKAAAAAAAVSTIAASVGGNKLGGSSVAFHAPSSSPGSTLGNNGFESAPSSPPLVGGGASLAPRGPALPPGFEGRPAGVSASSFMPRLLSALVRQTAYAHDHVFTVGGSASVVSLGGDGGGGGGGGDDEASLRWQELGDGLRKVFVNAVRAAPDAVLAYLTSPPPGGAGLLTPTATAALQRTGAAGSHTWPEAEVALSLLYHFGEGAPTSLASAPSLRCGGDVGGAASPPNALAVTLIDVLRSGLGAHAGVHAAVAVQWFEVAARYWAVFVGRSELLPPVLSGLVGTTGLRAPLPFVRSRTVYLLLKLVRNLVKAGPDGSLLLPFVDDLIRSLGDFLAVPFLHPQALAALQRQQQQAGCVQGGGGGGGGGGGDGPLPSPADADETRGASGLGSHDAQYVFECVGVLLGATWVPEDKRVGYTEAVLTPLLNAIDGGLQQLAALGLGGDMSSSPHASSAATSLGVGASGGVSGVGMGGGGATAGGGAGAGSAGAEGAFIEAHIAAWVVRVLNAIGHVSKGFGNVSHEPRLVLLAERALAAALKAVAVLPGHPSVRLKALFVLHRMVDCLNARLLPHLPALLPILLDASRGPEDVSALLSFTNQLTPKFKDACAPLLAAFLVPLVTRVFAVMPPQGPPPPQQAQAQPPQQKVVRGGGVAGSSGAAAPPGTLQGPSSEDALLRAELQRSYALFLLSLPVHGVSAEVLACPGNAPRLWDVLGTALEMARNGADPVLLKTCFAFFTALVKAWLPVRSTTGPAAAAANAAAAAAAAAVSSGTPQTDGGAAMAASRGAVVASPSPIGEPLRSQFITFVVEQLGARAAWAVVLSRCFDPSDAQCAALIGEAVGLHATIAVHVAAALGAPSPARQPPLGSGGGGASSDALAAMCGAGVLGPLGCPPDVAAAYVDRLRVCLHQPRDAKHAYLAVARAIRAAASAAGALPA